MVVKSHINCLITPHVQRERGKVIGVGVHYIYTCMYICLQTIESYFSDRFTFSNIRSRTSHLIYRLALTQHAPEKLSSLSKSRISVLNAQLALFVRRITQLRSYNSFGKFRHLVN